MRWYLRCFPWNLDPGTERTAAELAAVNDDVADEEAIAPVPGAPDFGKATKEKKKRDDYENKIAEVGLLSNCDDKIVLTQGLYQVINTSI